MFLNESFDFGFMEAIGSGDNNSTHLFASLGPWHTANFIDVNVISQLVDNKKRIYQI